MNERIYVIAGDYNQFINYVGDKRNQVYVNDSIRLRGLRKPKVKLIGTYYMRDDWRILKAELNLIEALTVEEP